MRATSLLQGIADPVRDAVNADLPVVCLSVICPAVFLGQYPQRFTF